jgi:nitronate monooxygenase
LATAVSNAGGLGILSALTFPTPDELAAKIRKTKNLTDKPFGVNITMLPTLRPVNIDGYIDVIIEEDVKLWKLLVEILNHTWNALNSLGLRSYINAQLSALSAPLKGWLRCRKHRRFRMCWAPRRGGHNLTNPFPLTVDTVKIPVVASGGFGDARGFVAALALGAEGVNMGTRFMATQEVPVHPKVKRAAGSILRT